MPERLMTKRRLLSTRDKAFCHGDRPLLSTKVTRPSRMSRTIHSSISNIVVLIMRDTIKKGIGAEKYFVIFSWPSFRMASRGSIGGFYSATKDCSCTSQAGFMASLIPNQHSFSIYHTTEHCVANLHRGHSSKHRQPCDTYLTS